MDRLHRARRFPTRVCNVLLFVTFAAAAAVQAQNRQDGWNFGIGTQLSGVDLNGDIGFPTGDGGTIVDVNLDNSEFRDLVQSGIGLGGFASKGRWTIGYGAGLVTLEDMDDAFEATWDRLQVEVAGTYRFAQFGQRNSLSALFGVRFLQHEWEIEGEAAVIEVDESWTDGVVGLVHTFQISRAWNLRSQVDASFGGSNGTYGFSTALSWRVFPRWVLSLNGRFAAIDFGDEDDLADTDFYLYDVDETSAGLGFTFLF